MPKKPKLKRRPLLSPAALFKQFKTIRSLAKRKLRYHVNKCVSIQDLTKLICDYYFTEPDDYFIQAELEMSILTLTVKHKRRNPVRWENWCKALDQLSSQNSIVHAAYFSKVPYALEYMQFVPFFCNERQHMDELVHRYGIERLNRYEIYI